jgi:aspartyl/glutamyl-tRNA(Asn/Gln) amidotransferase C subunit
VSVDADTVSEMATLARLSVPEDRIQMVAEEMSAILDFMGAIKQWEGEESGDTPPTTRRKDTPVQWESTVLIEDAAATQDGAVVVPPIKGAS